MPSTAAHSHPTGQFLNSNTAAFRPMSKYLTDVKGVGGISPVYLQLTKTLSSASEYEAGDHLPCYRVGGVLQNFHMRVISAQCK